MDVHRDISDVINNVVLRDVVQIHGMEIPYPAELWVDGECEHEHGTVMFSIGDRGLLTTEYFGYDNVWNKLEWRGMGFQRLDAKLILKDTRVEIPIWWISASPKARTWHSVPMPAIVAYKCEIQGQLGDPHSEMNSVSMTIAGLPDVGLGQMTTRIPEENTAVENLILRGFKRQAGLLKLDAGEWQVELTASYASDSKDARPLHHVNLSQKDGSPFRLPRDIDTSIIDALCQWRWEVGPPICPHWRALAMVVLSRTARAPLWHDQPHTTRKIIGGAEPAMPDLREQATS